MFLFRQERKYFKVFKHLSNAHTETLRLLNVSTGGKNREALRKLHDAITEAQQAEFEALLEHCNLKATAAHLKKTGSDNRGLHGLPISSARSPCPPVQPPRPPKRK